MDLSSYEGMDAYPAGTTTGRFLVLFEEGTAEAGVAALSDVMGARLVAASEEVTEPAVNEVLFFERLGVAVVDSSAQQAMRAGLMVAQADSVLAVEPERINHALEALRDVANYAEQRPLAFARRSTCWDFVRRCCI